MIGPPGEPPDVAHVVAACAEARRIVRSLAPHLPRMAGFHRRYMAANKILRLWARMVRTLDIDMIVPQHGSPLAGAAVQEFIDWVETLECGVDLMGERDYALPLAVPA